MTITADQILRTIRAHEREGILLDVTMAAALLVSEAALDAAYDELAADEPTDDDEELS